MFKLAKKPIEAGQSYMEAATCYLCTNFSKFEATSSYLKVAQCLKMEDPLAAVNALQHVIETYKEEGKFSMAAKYEKEVAEIYEKQNDEVSIGNAMKHYETAAELYSGEGSSQASSCLLKVAHMAANKNDFHKSIQIFEQIVNSLPTFASFKQNDLYLDAGLCYLCADDTVAAKRTIEKWSNVSNFGKSSQYEFLHKLVESCENLDTEGFENVVQEYMSLTADPWRSNLIGNIRDKIVEEEEEDLR